MLKDKEKLFEFIRFCFVGTIAAGIHYGIYYLLQVYINVNVAYTTGYLISLVFNFFLYIGISRILAPILVLAVAVPINFLLLRWVFKHKKKECAENFEEK